MLSAYFVPFRIPTHFIYEEESEQLKIAQQPFMLIERSFIQCQLESI